MALKKLAVVRKLCFTNNLITPHVDMSLLSRAASLSCCQRANFCATAAGRIASSPESIAGDFLTQCQSNGPRTRQQVLDSNQLQLLSATLNRSKGAGGLLLSEDSGRVAVPPGHHLVYFTPNFVEDELAADGSDTSYNPTHPFTRRMWAGGEILWPRQGEESKPNLLKIGDNVTESSQIMSAEAKKVKKTGEDMIFVGVEKSFTNNNGVAVIDRRNWVFRKALDTQPLNSNSPPQQSSKSHSPRELHLKLNHPKTARIRRFRQSDVTLFRFSALTFNSHKVHYSLPWATQVEGHRGLVVHGPLNVINILDFWRDVRCDIIGSNVALHLFPKRFVYRATSPLYADEEYQLVLQQESEEITKATICSCKGKIAMEATIEA